MESDVKTDHEVFEKIFRETKLEQQHYGPLLGITPSAVCKILNHDNRRIMESTKLLSCLTIDELKELQQRKNKIYNNLC